MEGNNLMKKLSQLFSIISLLLLVNIVINHNNNIKQRADTNTSLILTNDNLPNIIHEERRQLDEERIHSLLIEINEIKQQITLATQALERSKKRFLGVCASLKNNQKNQSLFSSFKTAVIGFISTLAYME